MSAASPERARHVLAGAWLGALLLACGPTGPSYMEDPGAAAGEVPLPALDDVDPEVVAAIRAAREAVRVEPEAAGAWGALADRLFAHDFLPQAAVCYRRAEELDPENAVWSYRLAWCLVDSAPEEALVPLERAVAAFDSYAPAHEVYGRLLMRLGRSDEAVPQLERASELDPRSAHAETGLGQIRLARGDFERARAHFEEALARNDKQLEAHVGMAQVYTALGQPEEARRHAERSRQLPPASRRRDVLASPSVSPAGARARTVFGMQLERKGSDDEAAEQYRLALESNPGYYLARRNLANLLVRQGRREEALELLREALRLDPDFREARADLTRLQREGAGGDG